MKRQIASANNQIKRVAIALALLLCAIGQAPLAFATEMIGGNQMSAPTGDDSLLPPEVVPLDPNIANTMAQSQAQTRANEMASPSNITPGIPGQDLSGMQTAQAARKAAYDALLGQNNIQPINQSFQNNFASMPGQMNGFAQNSQMVNMNGNQGQVGQSGWVQPGGSQTLTGGVAYKQQKQDIRRGGFSNALSAMAGLGTGLFLGSMVSRSYYSNPFGLGMLGLGMTGFGMRNGFRW